MKFTKSIMALAAAALGSASPVANPAVTDMANHTAVNIANHTVVNITSHTGHNMTKAALDYPSCTLWETWIHWEYDIWAANVEDIAGKCKGLWDNLPKVDCATHYKSYCGGIESTGLLQWHFWTTDLCSDYEVVAAFRAATGNSYGKISCVRGD